MRTIHSTPLSAYLRILRADKSQRRGRSSLPGMVAFALPARANSSPAAGPSGAHSTMMEMLMPMKLMTKKVHILAGAEQQPKGAPPSRRVR